VNIERWSGGPRGLKIVRCCSIASSSFALVVLTAWPKLLRSLSARLPSDFIIAVGSRDLPR
jgi:hypothetical protein